MRSRPGRRRNVYVRNSLLGALASALGAVQMGELYRVDFGQFGYTSDSRGAYAAQSLLRQAWSAFRASHPGRVPTSAVFQTSVRYRGDNTTVVFRVLAEPGPPISALPVERIAQSTPVTVPLPWMRGRATMEKRELREQGEEGDA